MIDYSYVECTSASMTALVAFAAQYPQHRNAEVRSSVQRGARFLHSIQVLTCTTTTFKYMHYYSLEVYSC
jgi:squalene cyclase